MIVHVFVSGFVQGIGFRQFVKSRAKDLGVTGWVRNTDDGRVEAVFSGSKEQIDTMLQFCKKGPMLAEVKGIALRKEENEKQFGEFVIF